MRIAVIGGTGLAGGHAVAALRRAGHEPVVLARSTGVDLETGAGLDAALAGVEAAIDAANAPAGDAAEAERVFGARTERLLEAERRAGVGHHVLLSILNVDRVPGNAHYAGKRRQEELVRGGPVPWTILRAAQFHEFAVQVVDWALRDGVAEVAPAPLQPAAAADVGEALAEIAAGPPLRAVVDLAGPEPQDLFDMAGRAAAAQGRDVTLVRGYGGVVGPDITGDAALPGPGARLAPTRFDDWLARQAAGREP